MTRPNSFVLKLFFVAALAACDEKPEAQVRRFEGVKADAKAETAAAATQFCDQVVPPSGAGAKHYLPPPEKPVAGYTAPASKDGAWRWVNLWATWCKPCVEEMGLLDRWQKALATDGLAVQLELVSIDEDGDALARWLQKPMPGRVRWLRGGDDLAPYLQSLGVDAGSAIPIHALVDPAGQLRCVRVGSVRDQDFAAIRAVLAGR
jgi:thiol-disulfide isomerase/thioredoxin